MLFPFKENFHSIAAAIFETFFLVSIVQVFLPQDVQSLELDTQHISVGSGPTPRVIHLVLDEHIGLEGIPANIPEGVRHKNQLCEFYEKYGLVT